LIVGNEKENLTNSVLEAETMIGMQKGRNLKNV